MIGRASIPACFTVLGLACLGLGGCTSSPNRELSASFERGDYPAARDILYPTLERTEKDDRDYILNRMRLGIVELADGRPRDAQPVFTDTFELLRRQGINDDKTVAATVFGEGGVIFWKGEPFEQALAFTYISMDFAMLGQWDNARAAAQASLFRLKDFGDSADAKGSHSKTPEQVTSEAIRRERASDGGMERYLDKGYTPIKTNFALGYFMNAVANLSLSTADADRRTEAEDNFREAFTLAPDLKPVADALLTGEVNTVLLVDYGRGPEKVAYGTDNALTTFNPRATSDSRRLLISLDYSAPHPSGIACDVNRMARDHLWNSFEDVRRAKSLLGNALLIGGTAVAVTSDRGNETQALVGLGMILAGALTKVTAQADLRHCELLPQRTFATAVAIEKSGSRIELSVEGDPGSRLSLGYIAPPRAGQLQLLYVRLPVAASQTWNLSGRSRYANDFEDTGLSGDDLPFILGGRCVRTPSLETLRKYQSAGYLASLTLTDLENLYRAEGIYWDVTDPASRNRNHILEGGSTLVPPVPGTTGYARTFHQDHPPYAPRSRDVRDLAAQERLDHSARPPNSLPNSTPSTSMKEQ